MRPIDVGCRVVCVDARFPEIGYHDCVALPRAEGVYTVEAVAVDIPDVVTRVRCSAIRLLELPWPRRSKLERPWWKMLRFRRLDDASLVNLIAAEAVHA